MKSEKLTDSKLIKAYKNGDNKAYEILLSRYSDKVYNFIFYKVFDTDITKDIYQETFCKAIIAIQNDKYSDTGKFYSWVCRIAYNLIMDHFKSDSTETVFSRQFDNFTEELSNDSSLSEKSFEDTIYNEQVLKDVVKIIGTLPKLQQEVVRMRYFEDLSFKEIAMKTNVSINTSMGRMRYALDKLRKVATENSICLELR